MPIKQAINGSNNKTKPKTEISNNWLRRNLIKSELTSSLLMIMNGNETLKINATFTNWNWIEFFNFAHNERICGKCCMQQLFSACLDRTYWLQLLISSMKLTLEIEAWMAAWNRGINPYATDNKQLFLGRTAAVRPVVVIVFLLLVMVMVLRQQKQQQQQCWWSRSWTCSNNLFFLPYNAMRRTQPGSSRSCNSHSGSQRASLSLVVCISAPV